MGGGASSDLEARTAPQSSGTSRRTEPAALPSSSGRAPRLGQCDTFAVVFDDARRRTPIRSNADTSGGVAGSVRESHCQYFFKIGSGSWLEVRNSCLGTAGGRNHCSCRRFCRSFQTFAKCRYDRIDLSERQSLRPQPPLDRVRNIRPRCAKFSVDARPPGDIPALLTTFSDKQRHIGSNATSGRDTQFRHFDPP